MSKRLTAAKTLLTKVEEWAELPDSTMYQDEPEAYKEKEQQLEKDITKWANRVIKYDEWGAW